MDIRTKLALAFVSVSLLSMWLLGTSAYIVSSDLLQEISERQLDALAESKKRDLENVIESWRNTVRLIRSRTQLRIQLREYQETMDDELLMIMQRIADDAQQSTASVERITLFGRDGSKVVSAGVAEQAAAPIAAGKDEEVIYSGFFLGYDGKPRVVFSSPVTLDEEFIGSVEVVVDVANVESLAANYRGLGKTGETMVIGRRPDGVLVLLHSLRRTDVSPTWDNAPEYIRAAVSGKERLFRDDAVDFRGNEVWAASRFLSDVDWGLVVKVDAEEETLRALTLRSILIDLGLALSAFAVVGGTLLGFYLARPIRELEQVLRRVRHGERSLRANVRPDDEVGFLAEALNEYLDHIHDKENRPDKK